MGKAAGETFRHIFASPRPRSQAIEKPGELGLRCALPSLCLAFSSSLVVPFLPAPSLFLTVRAGTSRDGSSAAVLPARGASDRAWKKGSPARRTLRLPGGGGLAHFRRSRTLALGQRERQESVCVWEGLAAISVSVGGYFGERWGCSLRGTLKGSRWLQEEEAVAEIAVRKGGRGVSVSSSLARLDSAAAAAATAMVDVFMLLGA